MSPITLYETELQLKHLTVMHATSKATYLSFPINYGLIIWDIQHDVLYGQLINAELKQHGHTTSIHIDTINKTASDDI